MPNDDLTFVQPPVMTQEHVDAMRTVLGWWPFPNMFDRCLLVDIHAHLSALLAQPVPHTLTPLERITHASNYRIDAYREPSFEDWLKEYDHLDADDMQSDQ